MSDYLTAGYDENLNRIEPNPVQALNPLAFDTFTSELSGEKILTTIKGDLIGKGISATNITTGEMSFDRAKGGTLILGGENNINGTFSLRDDVGNEKIALDKDGMVINNGKITINDKNNNSIIDSLGLVSSANFQSGNYYSTTEESTDSTSYVDTVENSTLNFILPRSAKILFMLTALMEISNTSAATRVINAAIVLDGTPLNPACTLQDIASNQGFANTISTHVVKTVTSGSHTIKIQFKTSNALNPALLYDRSLTYLILGS